MEWCTDKTDFTDFHREKIIDSKNQYKSVQSVKSVGQK